jgi:hypothetical protein
MALSSTLMTLVCVGWLTDFSIDSLAPREVERLYQLLCALKEKAR